MKCLEIISLRTSGLYKKDAQKYLRKVCREARRFKRLDADCYVHASIPGDLTLVISSQAQEGNFMGTDLGIYMADVLKKFGLVDHNCWLPVDKK